MRVGVNTGSLLPLRFAPLCSRRDARFAVHTATHRGFAPVCTAKLPRAQRSSTTPVLAARCAFRIVHCSLREQRCYAAVHDPKLPRAQLDDKRHLHCFATAHAYCFAPQSSTAPTEQRPPACAALLYACACADASTTRRRHSGESTMDRKTYARYAPCARRFAR